MGSKGGLIWIPHSYIDDVGVEEDDEDQINTASTISFNVGLEPKIIFYS